MSWITPFIIILIVGEIFMRTVFKEQMKTLEEEIKQAKERKYKELVEKWK